MPRLDSASVLAWIKGLKETDAVVQEEEIRRLRPLTPAETVREYSGLKTFSDWQDARSGDQERWHRRAAEEYRRMLEVFARAAGTRVPTVG